MDTQENLTQARETLLKINSYVEQTPILRRRFIEGEYNWLQFYQALIFLDLRQHYADAARKDSLPPKGFTIVVVFAYCGVLLISLVAFVKLMLFRPRILIFSTDKANSKYQGDFRLGAVYHHLKEYRLSFVEVFYTVLDQTFWNNIRMRRRSALYLQSIEAWASLFSRLGLLRGLPLTTIRKLDVSCFHEEEYIRFLIRKYDNKIARSSFIIRVLAFLLRLTGVKILLTIDSVRRYNELVAACKRVDIEVVAFQHGQFTKYQVGWLAASNKFDNVVKPNKLILWSEYWKRELQHFSTYFEGEELVIGGKPHEKKEIASTCTKKEGDGTTVLVPFEMGVPKAEVVKYIECLAACSNVSVLFKTRPDRDTYEQMDAYGITKGDRVEVVEDLADALARADVVVGAQSTLLYEMVEAGKPVLILDIGFDYTARMIANGLAERVSSDEDVCARLEAAAYTPTIELDKRRQILVGAEAVSIGKTLTHLLKTL